MIISDDDDDSNYFLSAFISMRIMYINTLNLLLLNNFFSFLARGGYISNIILENVRGVANRYYNGGEEQFEAECSRKA